MTITKIPVAKITVLPGRRRLDPAWVETLSDMFASQGQMVPIEVIATGVTFRLVYGGHRLAAAKLIGWTEIDAEVKSPADFASQAEITLREITENFARRDLSALDRAVDITRWREAYSAAHAVSKGGRRKAGVPGIEELTAKFAESFTAVSQKTFGLSERTITYAVKVASIDASVREDIALHAVADNQSELLLLAAEPGERQVQIAALLTSEPAKAGSVADAIAIIDRTPKPAAEPGWQKVAKSFSGLKPVDQDRFFDLHEAAIQRWLKERSAR